METRMHDWREGMQESLQKRLMELERMVRNCANYTLEHYEANKNGLQRESRKLQALEERAGGFDLGASRLTQLEVISEDMRIKLEGLEQVLEAFDPGCTMAREAAQWEQRASIVDAKMHPLLKELNKMQEFTHEQDTTIRKLKSNFELQEKKVH